jgi:GT2 family glycosyltransferase
VTRRVSVVIPVRYDRRVARTIASIREVAPPGLEVEIVVVDNGTEPAFSAWLAGAAEGATVVQVEEPGPYRARNAGVAAATGEVIFFTDADAHVLPGWFEAGLSLIDEGFDLVQGFSGSQRDDCISRLLQARYEARFRRLHRGEPTETDTRNLAVRRAVFDRVRFDERYFRVSDTEFGLRAEQMGFRVGYAPAMRVLHDHDEDLRVFAAKQMVHGWGAQRIMRETPGVRWHGGHLRLVARCAGAFERLPARGVAAWSLRRVALAGAGLLQASAARLPFRVALAALLVVDKTALLAGHVAYAPGTPELTPSAVLGRRLLRD